MTNQKTRHKRFKISTLFFIFLFIVVTTVVWLTMALLTARSDDTRNTFTLGKGVDISLTEPQFDKTAINKIMNFLPGDSVDKDPTMSIANGLDKEYIAATVLYYIDKDGDGNFSDTEQVTYTEFKEYASIGTNIDDKQGFQQEKLGEGWFTVDDYETFFYGKGTRQKDGIEELIPFEKEVNGVEHTTVLFNKVKIRTDIPVYKENMVSAVGTAGYKTGQPIAFQIHVKAYAVQAGEGITWQEAATDFRDSFRLNIGITDTTISDER